MTEREIELRERDEKKKKSTVAVVFFTFFSLFLIFNPFSLFLSFSLSFAPTPKMSAAFVAEVGAFCAAARRRQLRGPAACARRAAEILRLLVANGRHPDPCSLIADVRKWGAEMQAAAPLGEWLSFLLFVPGGELGSQCFFWSTRMK